MKILGNPKCDECGADTGYLRIWPRAKVQGGKTVAECSKCGAVKPVRVDAPDDEDVKKQESRSALASEHRRRSS